MSLKHAILGFLSVRPLSGYDLKRAFDHSVQHFWPADQSQIYRSLRQIHEAGFVEQEVIPRDGKLDVKIYHLTEAGQSELIDWLRTPLDPQDNREPFLIQLFFSGLLRQDELLALLKHQRSQIDDLLQLYRGVYNASTREVDDADFQRRVTMSLLTLEYGVRLNHAYRGWLDEVIQRIEQGDWSPPTWQNMLGQGDADQGESNDR
ncbi:MAG: PadR family transcriptional regulator [Chloroflexi bacterium]|nr:PadR family transcriptional regulator [Chloroflexota bacterium]